MPFPFPARWVVLCLAAALAGRISAGEEGFCIAGSVLNVSTGEPMRRAAVTIPQSAALTDAAGTFRFCDLSPGTYVTHAEKPGYAPSDSRVTVGPSREDLALRLIPLSAISGKVSDDRGEPLEHVVVQLLTSEMLDGRRKVRVSSESVTDDRGEYRIAGLSAGSYYLRVTGWQGRAPDGFSGRALVPLFYGGGSALSSAEAMKIEPGRDSRADFAVNLRPAYRIRGSVSGLAPLVPAKIELLGQDGEPGSPSPALDVSTGAFELDSVPPGAYTLRVTQGEGGERRRGELPVEVAADLNGLKIVVVDGRILNGNVRIEKADGGQPDSPNCGIRLAPAGVWLSGDAALETTTEPDGEFHLTGVLPGRYWLHMDCGSGYISAVHMGEADLSINGELRIPAGAPLQPVEATLSTDGGSVEVTGDEGSGSGVIVLVPSSGNAFYILAALFNKRARFTNVPPGDYLAYGWAGSAEPFEYASAEARQAWPGQAVSVQVGGRDRQHIRVSLFSGDSR